MLWLATLTICIANNLDNLAVGAAYGAAQIRIRWISNLWMGAVQLAITGAAVYGGQWAARWVPHGAAHLVGGAVFCALGLWMLLPSLRKEPGDDAPGERTSPGLFGILQDPQLADRDQSREIDLGEATLLGITLSLNNIGGGVSAGLIRLDPLAVAAGSAAISCLVVELGNRCGRRLARRGAPERAQVVAGILLMLFGLFQLR